MELHFATLFEAVADAFADDDALVHDEAHLSWTAYEDAAARFAALLAEHGVGHAQKVALCLYNCSEYLIAQFGVLKQRGVPINVNYRYLDDELAYLLDNADAEVLVYNASLADRVERVRARLPKLRVLVEVDDIGASELACATAISWADVQRTYQPARRIERSAEDLYMLYTGGTTGMPKGVMFRSGDFVTRLFTGYAYRGWTPPTDGDDLLRKALEHRARGDRRVAIPACPLMHGTGMWLGAFYAHLAGGSCVTLPGRRFDADLVWSTAERERADAVVIVGDAFGRPMLDALDRAVTNGRPYKLEDMRIIMSSGVMWSAEVQEGLLRHLDVRLVDSMGSTEAGMARRILTRGTNVETAVFELIPTTKVITDDGREVVPGSGEIGRLAAGAVVPIGYYKDEEKTAATFPMIDGRRYVLAGDYATVTEEGRVVLLGRGSNCINTAGEKVFPEEVEEAIKRHPSVVDCLVVGVPDPSFGERIAAAVSVRDGLTAAALLEELRTHISSYKVPRIVRIVDVVQRAANGKADYNWAKDVLST